MSSVTIMSWCSKSEIHRISSNIYSELFINNEIPNICFSVVELFIQYIVFEFDFGCTLNRFTLPVR